MVTKRRTAGARVLRVARGAAVVATMGVLLAACASQPERAARCRGRAVPVHGAVPAVRPAGGPNGADHAS